MLMIRSYIRLIWAESKLKLEISNISNSKAFFSVAFHQEKNISENMFLPTSFDHSPLAFPKLQNVQYEVLFYSN